MSNTDVIMFKKMLISQIKTGEQTNFGRNQLVEIINDVFEEYIMLREEKDEDQKKFRD